MRVLIVHNRYQQKGGEDAVALSEKRLLANNGVEVELLEVDNDAIVGLPNKLAASVSVFYSRRGVELLNAAITRFAPDVVHVHNWFPTLSPAIFWACRRRGVPVVNTLHNYRLLCAGGTLFRDGGVCEDCIGTALRLPGIHHGCYRGSHAGTFVATAAMLTHWKLGTWDRAVGRFIALSEFARKKLIEGGLPAARLVVKPNFLDSDPGPRPGNLGYFAFVGRLTEEKGIPALLNCWRRGTELPLLRIVGTGPLEDEVRQAAASLENVEWLGAKSADEVLDVMGGAMALLCPSMWYEGMPRVVIEALAVGTPVIASRLGSYVEMIVPGKFGDLFDTRDPEGLLACLQRLVNDKTLAGMRTEARNEFVARYSGPANLKLLRQIYEQVISESSTARRKSNADRHRDRESAARPSRQPETNAPRRS